MGHREDLNTLPASDRQALVDLMLTYLTDDIVDDHMAIVHSGVQIFTGHRAYIGAMETWLQANGGAAFLPLPYWNPANPIPAEFNVVKATDGGMARPPLVDLTPNMAKPAQFEWPAVCSYDDADDLGNAINGWHGGVHCTIGGTMCNIMQASAAPIFWCWHAFVDHIYWDWQRCTVVCPDTVGATLTVAKNRLRLAGLRVGTVTRLPRFVLPREQTPFPFPIPEPDPAPFESPVMASLTATHAHAEGAGHGGGHDAPALRKADPEMALRLAEWKRHMIPRPPTRGPRVIDQSPNAGVSVKQGSAVDLTVLGL